MSMDLKKLVAAGQLDDVYDALITLEHQNEDAINEIIIQKSRYRRLQRNKQDGIMAASDIDQESNELKINALGLIDKHSLLLGEKSSSLKEDFKRRFIHHGIQLAVIRVLMQHQDQVEGLIITEIQNLAQLTKSERGIIVAFLNELDENDLASKREESKGSCWRLSAEGINFFAQFLAN